MTTDNEKLQVLKTQPITSWEYPRIILGVPQERAMSYSEDVFFWRIAMQGVPILQLPYDRVDVARNKMAIELLRSDFTHLLMLDIDHVHPWNIVQRLAKWVLLKPEVQVVGGLNFRRGEPYDPCCGYWGDDGKYYTPAEWGKGLIQVDLIGTGSILIAREVFEIIPPPWFTNDYSKAWADLWPGEDATFSRRCNDYEIDLYVDTQLSSPHLRPSVVTEDTFRKYMNDNGTETGKFDEVVERARESA
jgi:hypothetical protein